MRILQKIFCDLFLLCLILFLTDGQFANAVTSTNLLTKNGKSVQITAESMFGDYEKNIVTLVGAVQISFDGQILHADRVVLDKNQKMFIAEGNVVIASPSAYVEGSRAHISYEDSTGLIYDGYIKSGQVLFQGNLVKKTGPESYVAEKASYTACTTCPPAWSFSGSRIDADIGSYAYIKSAWFYLGGIRFFWLPYLIVPLKSERQTGLLFPEFESRRSSFGIVLPFFWAIARNQDLTISPKFYLPLSDTEQISHDPKFVLNHRYVFSTESRGETNFGFGHDSVFANDSNLPEARKGRANRWYFNHTHYYELPNGFINRVQLNAVSDLLYTRDYPDEMPGRGEPALENRISLTKNSETLHTSAEATFYVNQLKSNPLESNADSVHRFPEIRQSGTERSLFDSRLFFKWDIQYINFSREDFAFDDVITPGGPDSRTIDPSRGDNGDPNGGVFNPATDQIRAGQRIDFRPELSLPIRIGTALDILPSLQFRHTQYSFNVTPPAGSNFNTVPMRDYIRAKLSVRTLLSRVYDLSPPPESESETRSEDIQKSHEPEGIFQALQPPPVPYRPDKMKHEIEPEISISGIPWLEQTDSPFFGRNSLSPIYVEGQPVSDSDFFSDKKLQFDYEDRITSRNIISTQIINRFIKKTWSDDKPVYRQVVLIKNGISYEYDKPKHNISENLSDFYTIIDARYDYFDMNTSLRYFPLHRLLNTSSRVAFRDTRGDYIQLSFSQNSLITEKVSEAYAKRDENLGLDFGFQHRYAVISVGLNYLPVSYSTMEFDLKSWSFNMNLRPPGDCWAIRFSAVHDLAEPSPRYTFGLDYSFGGELRSIGI